MKFDKFYNKKTVGVIEPIVIAGVGKCDAKVDSGNDGYNVIDGQDMKIRGDAVEFTFQGKRITKPVKEFLNVHIGDSNIDKRPVVELDIKFKGRVFKKVLFSVANRELNDYKILISRDFIGQNGFLIDVTKK